MGTPKRKRTAAERRARRERRKTTKIVFINGKQKRVPRPQLIAGLEVDEFIRRNADPIWLHQNEMWEYMPVEEDSYFNLGKLENDSVDQRLKDSEYDPPDFNLSDVADFDLPF